MKQYYCEDCLNVFKHFKGKCKECGSKNIKEIEVNIQKQTIME